MTEAKSFLPSEMMEGSDSLQQVFSSSWGNTVNPEDGDPVHHPAVDPESQAIYPERQALPLPSLYSVTEDSPPTLKVLRMQQLELEKGQANDALHRVRLAIGHKGFLYRKRVRLTTNNYTQRTRSYTEVAAYNLAMLHHADVYNHCRATMVELGADEATLAKYKVIVREDLFTDTSAMDLNERGMRNKPVSWIWTIANPNNEDTPGWMKEGQFH